MKNVTLIVLISIFLCQCKKDEQIVNAGPNETIPSPPSSQFDTAQSLNYYPIYPGSFWRYLENNSDTVLYNTSATYLKHSYLTWQGYDSIGNWVMHYSDTVYVPFLNNNPIYQYNKIDYVFPPFGGYYTQWPILSETVGFQFERGFSDHRYGDFSEKVIVEQKTVNSSLDSVIILKGHWVWGPNVHNISIQEYVKNVGLSSHMIIDTVAMDTLYSLQLINYYINN